MIFFRVIVRFLHWRNENSLSVPGCSGSGGLTSVEGWLIPLSSSILASANRRCQSYIQGKYSQWKKNCIFDAGDVDYLVNLPDDELIKVINKPEVKRAFYIADRWPDCLGTDDFFWYDLGMACQLALSIQRSYRPKAQSRIKKTTAGAGQIKDSIDIVAYISRYTKLSSCGNVLKGLCPFHQEQHASFYVYPKEHRWHCYGKCNTGGDIIDFVMRKEGVDFRTVLSILSASP